jgi:hypothetical protein
VLAQPLLDLRLFGRACAQLAGHALAGLAVGHQLGLEHLDTPGDRLERRLERRGEPLGRGREALVAHDHRRQALDAGGTLGALLGRAVGDAALGRKLALHLRAADGRGALLWRRAALLDQPRGTALGLSRGGALAVGLAHGAVGVLAAGVGG